MAVLPINSNVAVLAQMERHFNNTDANLLARITVAVLAQMERHFNLSLDTNNPVTVAVAVLAQMERHFNQVKKVLSKLLVAVLAQMERHFNQGESADGWDRYVAVLAQMERHFNRPAKQWLLIVLSQSSLKWKGTSTLPFGKG